MMPEDSNRSNIDLQDEYLASKQQIETQFKNGDIKPIYRMFSIDEKDLRPSVE